MKITADLHIHSKYSRATSKELDIANLEKYARIKGLNLLGTGDFTHPLWFKELKQNLKEDGTGFLKTKTGFDFVLQTEVSLMYSQDGKGRKVHHIILAPSLDVVSQINEALGKRWRLNYDGRPIFGINSVEFVEMMMKISKEIEIIPAHILTPWFGLFGSNSGFDKIEDCFKDQLKYIHALETGLSSDPAMNWRLSALDKYSLISNSDLHSFWPWRIGRECNIFDIKPAYKELLNALKTKSGFTKTIEFWPHEGKYHYDGHRACNVCMKPSEAIKHKNICPVCGKTLTIGVAHRVEELADRPEGFKPKGAVPFTNLIPLSELIAGVLNTAVATQKVWAEYNALIKAFGTEIDILLDVDEKQLKKTTSEKIAEIIIKNRNQKIEVKPGYDGVYGKPILNESDLKEEKVTKIKHKQTGLDDFC